MKTRMFFAACFVVLLSVAPARAGDTHLLVKGTVKFYDTIRNTYQPARNVLVEIQGYRIVLGAEIPDPTFYFRVLTNQDGWFGKSRKKILLNPKFKIHITAHAETPIHPELPTSECRTSVYRPGVPFASVFPYSATRRKSGEVSATGTVTLNFNIGGPSSNTAHTNFSSAANAFLLHREVRLHQARLKRWGFPDSLFDDTDVIAPSNAVNSMYNPLTGYIDIVILPGLGTWSNLANTPDADARSHPRLLVTTRHEASHALHFKLAPIPPLAWDYQSVHDPETESNPHTAYIEGWAEFLPQATLQTDGGRFEAVPDPPNRFPTPQLDIPTDYPPGDHGGWEGEVAAVFWDLHDPAGQVENLRHTPRESETDGETVPEPLRRRLTWTDRIADPRLTNIRSVVADIVNGFPCQDIHDVLDKYRRRPGVNLHDLKAIAYNRGIPLRDVAQRRPRIDGQIELRRRAVGGCTASFRIVEEDPEDRPRVTVSYWLERPGLILSQIRPSVARNLQWSGSSCRVSDRLAIPVPGSKREHVWIVVSDEIYPRAYRMGNPPRPPRLRNRLRDAVMRATPQVTRAEAAAPRRVRKGSPRLLSSREKLYAARLTKAIRAVRRELRAAEFRQQRARDHEILLYQIARQAGGLRLRATTPSELVRRGPLSLPVKSVAHRPDPRSAWTYRRWLRTTATGRPPPRQVAAICKPMLDAYARQAPALAQQQERFAGRVQQLRRTLAAAHGAIRLDRSLALLQRQTAALVRTYDRTLRMAAADRALAPRLREQERAMRVLRKR